MTDFQPENTVALAMKSSTIEIVAPAGDLESGLYAFQAGAGAVYFGLSQFSARRAAVNLSLSDAGRLKAYADKHGKKIYAAINTVIAQDELHLVLDWVKHLALMDVDAIIIQDLGLAASIRDCFPKLPLHASTQLGAHNRLGIKAAGSLLGIERFILSRELSVDEIEILCREFPKIELEVFVHGALCYGFSGLCLASDMITNRSGNRGECAQICRSWFEHGKEKGYYFSCLDLDAGGLIDQLKKAGVVSLKIEGRMKNAAYCFNTVAYYRALLDGDRDKAAFFREQSAVCFSRPKSEGYLRGIRGSLVNPSYPSHVGIPGAEVISVKQGRATIRALADLNAHDRLMRVPKGPPDRGDTIVLQEFFKKGKKTKHLMAGEVALIDTDAALQAGLELSKTLSYDMHLKTLSPAAFNEHKKKLALMGSAANGALHLGAEIMGAVISRSYDVQISKSRQSKPFTEVLLSLFSTYKDYPFSFDRLESFPDLEPITDDVFIPPSMLKKIRNEFYENINARISSFHPEPHVKIDLSAFSHPLPQREHIIYPNGFPFLIEGDLLRAEKWPLIDKVRYLSLPPVMFKPDKTLAFIKEEIANHLKEPLAVGLNNVGHLSLISEWALHEKVFFYIDYGLYVANAATLSKIGSIGNVRGAYLWLEANENQLGVLLEEIKSRLGSIPLGIRPIKAKQIFPMFVSRICFARSISNGTCPKSCPCKLDYRIHQNRRHFDVRIRDCITYVFALPESPKAKSGA